MPEGQVLEFSHVSKRFGDVQAVTDLSARIEPGTVTGFLGPNGAGKTTTLRMLLGLVRPTSGDATIGGRAYRRLDDPLQTVGAVLEASSFHPGRTAVNHLKVLAQAGGLPAARIDEVLGLVGLADAAGRRVGGFSLGMRQRLGLAAALLGDPGVLVLDEPANGLDPEGITWMRQLLQALAAEGRTVLMSSHLLAEVAQTVDRLLIIATGRLVFEGAIEDLADRTEYATVVDAPDRAALEAALREAGIVYDVLRGGLTARGEEPERIGALAAAQGIALSTLQRRGPSLEDVFFALVNGAAAPSPAAERADPPTPEQVVAPTALEPAARSLPASASAPERPSTPPPHSVARGPMPPDAGRPLIDHGGHAAFAVASTGVIDIVPASTEADGEVVVGEPDAPPADDGVASDAAGTATDADREADAFFRSFDSPTPRASGTRASGIDAPDTASDRDETDHP